MTLYLFVTSCRRLHRSAGNIEAYGKEQLQASPLLVYNDHKKPLRLACDAFLYGVGAEVSHAMENGEDRPIAFASHTLTVSERN